MDPVPFRLIIAGGRNFDDYAALKKFALQQLQNILTAGRPIVVISGNARGADTLGERLAAEMNWKCERYPADWTRYGLSAGYRRNEDMAKIAHGLLACWDGVSRGTKHMIDIAQRRQLQVVIHYY